MTDRKIDSAAGAVAWGGGEGLSDEIGLSFWRPSFTDVRLNRSRHIVFNLSRPEKSLMLLALLSKEKGGFGKCVKDGEAVLRM